MIWLHVSELSIDRLLAGELRRDDADAMRDHARACKACGDRLAGAEATRREFARLAPRLPIARPQIAPGLPIAQPQIAPRLSIAQPQIAPGLPIAPRPRTIALVGGVVAAAAAIALFIAWPGAGHGNQQHGVQVAQSGDRTNGDRTNGGAVAGDRTNGGAVAGERTKGRAIAGFFVAHDGDMRRGGVRETVTPGDRLQLFTTSSVPSWFAVVSVDERGVRSVYVEPRVIEPGTERLLPLSLELDDALGTETLFAIFCAERFDPLGVDLSQGSGAGPPLPQGCTIDRYVLDKVAR